MNAADAAGGDILAAAERLALALDPSARIVLLDALASAADEVTAALQGGGVVELRLRGREPQLVVQGMQAPPPAVPSGVPSAPAADEAGTSRVSLRLPESLKARAEEIAAADGVSLNTWIVRVINGAVDPSRNRGPIRTGNRLSGWARA